MYVTQLVYNIANWLINIWNYHREFLIQDRINNKPNFTYYLVNKCDLCACVQDDNICRGKITKTVNTVVRNKILLHFI